MKFACGLCINKIHVCRLLYYIFMEQVKFFKCKYMLSVKQAGQAKREWGKNEVFLKIINECVNIYLKNLSFFTVWWGDTFS